MSAVFCIVCGNEFRPADPEVVICPACGGPPKALVPGQPQHTVLMNAAQVVSTPGAKVAPPQGTVGMESAAPRHCIICSNEFHPTDPEVVICPSCGGPLGAAELTHGAKSLSKPTEWKEGTLILGEYRIEKILGEGGFGKVYLVRSERTRAVFAVKRARLTTDSDSKKQEETQRNLIDELRVWVDLPLFPHVVPCRFFRTIENEIIIFTEYVEGGSLAEWIKEKKLYAGGNEGAGQRILDLAIQFAWGLHFLHCLGYVHQDVKPANALLTPDGTLKVNDFGLARTKIKAISLKYTAPEQEIGGTIDARTDIWSWGVSVLEMFTGEATWLSGSIAAAALEEYLSAPPADLPRMPPPVVDILRRCFEQEPSERWSSALEAAQALQDVYESLFGPFPRSAPLFPERQVYALSRKIEGAEWHDPLPYLRRALETAGRDPAEADHFATDRTTSLQSQAVADLACYQEAIRIYEQIKPTDWVLLADLYANQALVQQYLADAIGAISSFDQAIQALEKIVFEQQKDEHIPHLALIYGNKGFLLARNGRYEESVHLYDRAIDILKPHILTRGQLEGLTTLVVVYNNKALAQSELGQERQASETFDQVIAILEDLSETTQHPRIINQLAVSLSNKARSLVQLYRYQEAIQLCDRAITLQEDLFLRQGQEDVAEDIALSYANKGSALHCLEQFSEALLWLDKAIQVYEGLIFGMGQRQLAGALAGMYSNKANALRNLHRFEDALRIYDQAIALDEEKVFQEGRWDLAHQLAQHYLGKATTLHDSGQHQKALEMCSKPASFLERLVLQEKRLELADDLAGVYQLQAIILHTENETEAIRFYDRAIDILESSIRAGNWRLGRQLVAVCGSKSELLVQKGEFASALAIAEKTLFILEEGIRQGVSWNLHDALAEAYYYRGIALSGAHRYRESVSAFDRAIELYQQLLKQGRQELAEALARSYHNKARNLEKEGDYTAALEAYNQTVEVLESLSPSRADSILKLATAYIDRSSTLCRLGRFSEAIHWLEKARQVLETKTNPEQPEVAGEIARAYNDQAFALDELQRYSDALPLYDRAIQIREQLVHQQGRHDAVVNLLTGYNNKAFALLNLGRQSEAITFCDKAIALGEQRWHLSTEETSQLAKELSVSHHRKATVLARQGKHREAAALYEKSIQLLEPLVLTQGRWEFCFGLANVMANRAFCLFQTGRYADGQRVLDHALEVIDKGLEQNCDPRLFRLRQQIQNMR